LWVIKYCIAAPRKCKCLQVFGTVMGLCRFGRTDWWITDDPVSTSLCVRVRERGPRKCTKCVAAGCACARSTSDRARAPSVGVRARARPCVCVCRNAGWRDRVRVFVHLRVCTAYVWACAGAGALPFSRRVRGRVLLVGLIRRLCVCVCTRRQVNWSSAYSRKPSASSVFWVSRSVRWALPRALAGWRGSSSSIYYNIIIRIIYTRVVIVVVVVVVVILLYYAVGAAAYRFVVMP